MSVGNHVLNFHLFFLVFWPFLFPDYTCLVLQTWDRSSWIWGHQLKTLMTSLPWPLRSEDSYPGHSSFSCCSAASPCGPGISGGRLTCSVKEGGNTGAGEAPCSWVKSLSPASLTPEWEAWPGTLHTQGAAPLSPFQGFGQGKAEKPGLLCPLPVDVSLPNWSLDLLPEQAAQHL